MTTIAASLRHKQIAADSMCSGEGYFYLVDKIFQGEHSWFGAAGEWHQIQKFLHGMEKDEVDPDLEVTVLEIREDGLYMYDQTPVPFKINNEYYAIGSGAPYALAAMYLGKSPAEAVEVAALFDPGTRAPIKTQDIGVIRAAKTKICR